MSRARIALVAAVAASFLSVSVAGGSALKSTKPAAGVHPAYSLRAETKRLTPATLLVQRLRIAHTGPGLVRVDCPGGCRRRRGGNPRVSHKGTSAIVERLNVVLNQRRVLRVRIIVPDATSRYLNLGIRHRRLVIVAAGCVGRDGKPVSCPANVAPTPTPVVTPTVIPTVVPPIVKLGAKPHGALLFAQRVDASRIRLTGWAQDADAPDTALTVRALVDGERAGEGVANATRGDVGSHGFDFEASIDELVHTICVTGLNVGGGSDGQLGECLKVARFADLDRNGVVGCSDVAILDAHYGQPGGYNDGDLNGDGTVTGIDLSILSSRFNSGESGCP